MTITREAGQSLASATALAAWAEAAWRASDAHFHVRSIERELRKARAEAKAAEAAERKAEKVYLKTPYAETESGE